MTLSARQKGYLWDMYDVEERKLSQDAAGYNPVGMQDNKACANCNWFVLEENACVVVAGDISPTGLSNLFREKLPVVQQPIPVTVVKEHKPEGILAKVGGALAQLKGKLRASETPVQAAFDQFFDGTGAPFALYETEDGTTRFLSRASNNFKDRENQTIYEAAHKEYVQWADNTGLYPPLLWWHIPGARLGQVDWMDYSDGFLCASGTILPEMVPVVTKAMENGNLGMSHGYYPLLVDQQGDILQYRGFEQSILPLQNAANIWNSFPMLKDMEEGMAITAKKRESLKALGVTDEQIDAFDAVNTAAVKALTDAGIEYKEVESEQQSVLPELTMLTGAVTQLATAVTQQGAQLTQFIAAQEATNKDFAAFKEVQEKSFEERMEEVYKSKVATHPAGFVASESSTNVDGVVNPQTKELAEKEFFSVFVENVADGIGVVR